MVNEKFVLSMAKAYVNKHGEIDQERLSDLMEGLEEDEVNEALAILSANNIRVVEDTESDAVFFCGSNRLQKLTNEELCVMYRKGDQEALEALTVKNERLVKKIAYDVLRDYRPESLDAEDLYIIGTMGLMKAAARFDVSLGNKFSTYACWWIRQAITREVMDTGYSLRLPVHVFDKVIKVNKARKALRGGTPEEIRKYLLSEYGTDFATEEICQLIKYGDKYLNTASLNKVVGEDDGDAELIDFIPDEKSVEEEVVNRITSEEIEGVLSTLTEKESRILRMRFGLAGYDPMTLEEVAAEYHVTRERIRQIEAKALAKLAQPSRRHKLEGAYAA